ncbi:hypothetical protein EDD22DRAFT_1054510 [Suillus occidentalis]|nr:hypothetical protein EDD22DRAFT_1054510 [Suillus occidentalis]
MVLQSLQIKYQVSIRPNKKYKVPHADIWTFMNILIINEGGTCLECIGSVKDGRLHLGICDSAASIMPRHSRVTAASGAAGPRQFHLAPILPLQRYCSKSHLARAHTECISPSQRLRLLASQRAQPYRSTLEPDSASRNSKNLRDRL